MICFWCSDNLLYLLKEVCKKLNFLIMRLGTISFIIQWQKRPVLSKHDVPLKPCEEHMSGAFRSLHDTSTFVSKQKVLNVIISNQFAARNKSHKRIRQDRKVFHLIYCSKRTLNSNTESFGNLLNSLLRSDVQKSLWMSQKSLLL